MESFNYPEWVYDTLTKSNQEKRILADSYGTLIGRIMLTNDFLAGLPLPIIATSLSK